MRGDAAAGPSNEGSAMLMGENGPACLPTCPSAIKTACPHAKQRARLPAFLCLYLHLRHQGNTRPPDRPTTLATKACQFGAAATHLKCPSSPKSLLLQATARQPGRVTTTGQNRGVGVGKAGGNMLGGRDEGRVASGEAGGWARRRASGRAVERSRWAGLHARQSTGTHASWARGCAGVHAGGAGMSLGF